MKAVSTLQRFAIATLACVALVPALCAAVARAQDPLPTDKEILESKCTICHSGHRVYRLKSDQIRAVVERMRILNPDQISTNDSDHISQVIEKLLGDPNAIAQRDAWLDAVARGEALFKDVSLGTTGKSCSSCHSAGSLKHVEDSFPRFDPALKRFVDIQEAINLMIRDKQKGTPLPPNDQRYFDLLAYIKSLK